MTDTTGLEIEISPDRLAVVLRGQLGDRDPAQTARAISQDSAARGIVNGLSEQEIAAELIRCAAPGEGVVEILLATGTPPTPPREPRMEWAGDFFSHEYVINETTGAADYRQLKSNPSVREGQLLLTLIPGEPGQDGVDVLGKRIPAEKTRRLVVRPGRNVAYSEATGAYTARMDGRVRFVKGILSVDEVLSVSGSVGLATGHISHPGALEVKGNIEPGSRVMCAGHICVSGYVDSADVETQGNLDVVSGLTGMGKAPIRVAGSVHAKFIIDARVEAGEDVVVEREIVHSIISARKSVFIPEGRLVGGRVHGCLGLDVKAAGSAALVPTLLSAGITEAEASLRLEREKRIARLRAKADRIHAAVLPLVGQLEHLPRDKKDTVSKLIDTEQILKEEITVLEEEAKAANVRPHPKILVRGIVFPETTFCIDQVTIQMREMVHGPVVAKRIGDQVRLETA